MSALIRTFFLWLSKRRRVGDWLESAPPADRLLRRFVAGDDHDEAIETAQGLVERGFRVTFSLLGEDVIAPTEATAAADQYRTLLEGIAKAGLASESKIAVKPSLLGLGLNYETALGNLLAVLEAARWVSVPVELDMERSDSTDNTLALFRAGVRETPTLGVAIQACLRRSGGDVAALIEQRIAHVRLVKGAYSEPAELTYSSPARIEKSFHDLVRVLLDAKSIEGGASLGVATHDMRLIAEARTRAFRKQTPADRWEVQMLYGVKPSQQQALLDQGYAVRVYLPYGPHWYPYFLRRVAERPGNLWFALRSVFSR